jgi:hypothetical protein
VFWYQREDRIASGTETLPAPEGPTTSKPGEMVVVGKERKVQAVDEGHRLQRPAAPGRVAV